MKKITLLLAFLITSIGFSQAPTTNATDPIARSASDVISIYGDTYSSISGVNYDPNWGQSGHQQVNAAFDPGTGKTVLAYPNFNYQGTDINANKQVASGMEFIHIDIFVPSTVTTRMVKFSPIDDSGNGPGEVLVEVPITPGSWSSVDLAKSAFTGMSWDRIKELKFDGQFNSDGSANTSTSFDIYVDNIYFWKNPADPTMDATLNDIKVDGTTIADFGPDKENYSVELAEGTTVVPTVTATSTNSAANIVITPAGTIPGDTTIEVTAQDNTTKKTYTISFFVPFKPSTAAPSQPARNASDVISLYSGDYTDVTGTLDAGWCGGNSIEKVMISGNETIKYLNNGCQGIVFDAGVDASSFTNLHINYYIEDGITLTQSSTFHLKLVQQPGGAAKEILGGIDAGRDIILETGKWVTVDLQVDMTQFTGLKEFGITSNINGKIWYDNLYVYKGQPASVENNGLLGFSMYPNPANNILNISAKETIQNADIFNVLGKRVMSVTINKTNDAINVSDLASGIYLIKYTVNDKVGTAKFIKQ